MGHCRSRRAPPARPGPLFFAGHGYTQTRTLPNGPLQTGYIIPFDGDGPEGSVHEWGVEDLVSGIMLVSGLFWFWRARRAARRAAWLRTNGLALEARVLNADRTGTEINDVPVLRFTVQVVGPKGPYIASFRKLATEIQAMRTIGQTVRVRAAPDRLTEIILEE